MRRRIHVPWYSMPHSLAISSSSGVYYTHVSAF
jgi:hypothetical protein